MHHFWRIVQYLRQAATGFSTFLADFRYLGRDFPKAAPGFSTHMRNIRRLGRDSQPKPDATRLPITP